MICPFCKKEHADPRYSANTPCLVSLTLPALNIEYPQEGGTFTNILGFKHPHAGYPEKVTLGQNATVKRALISTVKIFFKVWRHPIKSWIDWLADVYQADYIKHQIPENQLCRSAREILRVGRLFAKSEHELRALWCIVMMWEMDDAYRFRGQDVLAELKKENLNRIRKEVNRLLKIGMKREISVVEKRRTMSFAVRLSLFIPSVRKFVKDFLNELNLEEIKPTTADLYWMTRYEDYNFAGLSYEIRLAWHKQEDEGYVPPTMKIEEYANIDIRPNEPFYKLKESEAKEYAQKVKIRIMEEYKKKNDKT